jgi:hypothetical protein
MSDSSECGTKQKRKVQNDCSYKCSVVEKAEVQNNYRVLRVEARKTEPNCSCQQRYLILLMEYAKLMFEIKLVVFKKKINIFCKD